MSSVRKKSARATKAAAAPVPLPVDPANPVRQRIIAGARSHFLAHGFRGVTMDDLAQELGMSKKTFYAHFSSKLDLVKAVMQTKVAQATADIARITSGPQADFLTVLHRFLACVQEHTQEIQPPFVRDLRREAPELFQIVEEGRRKMIREHFGKVFSQGRKESRVRKDVPVELIVEILLAATESIVNPARMAELGITPASAYLGIISVVLEGALIPERKS